MNIFPKITVTTNEYVGKLSDAVHEAPHCHFLHNPSVMRRTLLHLNYFTPWRWKLCSAKVKCQTEKSFVVILEKKSTTELLPLRCTFSVEIVSCWSETVSVYLWTAEQCKWKQACWSFLFRIIPSKAVASLRDWKVELLLGTNLCIETTTSKLSNIVFNSFGMLESLELWSRPESICKLFQIVR